MIRAPMGDQQYWNEWVAFGAERIEKEREVLRNPSANPTYMPQYAFDLSVGIGRHLLRRYCRGDEVVDLARHFPDLLDAWELSNRLSEQVCQEEGVERCRDWDFHLRNLNHYNWCFWLVGLALLLEVPEDHWERLIDLVGGEEEDLLLDLIIRTRQPGRRVGKALLHVQPYGRLLSAVHASKPNQGKRLMDFLDHWYVELKRPPTRSRVPAEQPFWYEFGDPALMPLEQGSYFGRWCIEAAAAVKVFGLDDSKCRSHEYYPVDLVYMLGTTSSSTRPEGAPIRSGFLAWMTQLRKNF